MQAPYDKYLVSAPQRHDDALGVRGLDGQELVKATLYDEEIHRTSRVTIVGSPLGLRTVKESLEGTRYASDDVRALPAAGDTAYVDWSALAEVNQPDPVNHPHLYSVSLDQIVALPDGCGGFRGFAGYVLCEPVFPDTVQVDNVEGKITASGIVLVSDVKPTDEPMGDESNIAEQVPTRHGIRATPYEGLVRYTGTPNRNQADEVKAYDHVLFDRAICGRSGYPLRVKLEGREFYAVRRDYIAAVRTAPAYRGLCERHLVLPLTEDTQADYKAAA